ncbi:hypothetical protein [Pararhizobium mangrovi]|uniref:Protein TolA n=1 Tax=Pararhizobium mangrovi TaxID=2590452 RepID=A0A506UHB7_9HYPH|nr:hypothetical protein [Pararhizobium mangrovi]TPW32701.1 hypothetical protein FJU11_00285 [Pararhizobium mangrovi]
MKTALVTSAVLHAAVISWALVSLSAPRTLDVADMEAVPVDIVPVESITRTEQGDKKAPKSDTPAPKPTQRPDPVKDAKNVGDNTVDLDGPSGEKPSKREVKAAAPPKADEKKPEISDEKAAEPKPAPKAPPKPKETEVASLPKPQETPEPAPAPAPDEAAKAAPAPDEPQPAPEDDQPAKEAAPDFASLPDAGPTPASRPKPPAPKPEEAEKKPEPKPEKKTEEPKPEEMKVAEAKPDDAPKPEDTPKDEPKPNKAAASKKSDFDADQIAAMLNRDKQQGGGAKRSDQEASLGTTKPSLDDRLTLSEMDALRSQIQRNWNIIPGLDGADEVRIRVSMRLDPSGAIVGQPQVDATGGPLQTRQTLASGARRAVQMASPFQGLPREKYDSWSEVVVNFDPSRMY